jgi:hypothetical protein
MTFVIATPPIAVVYEYKNEQNEGSGFDINTVELMDYSKVGQVFMYEGVFRYRCRDQTGVIYASIILSELWIKEHINYLQDLLHICAKAMTLVQHVPKIDEFKKKTE